MKRRVALVASFLLAAAAPAPRKHAPPPVVLPDIVRIVITTELGPITIDLDHLHAPLTTENFVHYIDQKRLDGTTFYRAMRLEWGTPPNGLIRAGHAAIQNAC